MSKKKGKAFGKRDIVPGSDTQPNQWQASVKQQSFIVHYLTPKSETFGNAYQSAIKAGYSESYAKNIMNPSMAVEWVRQAQNVIRLNPEHLKTALAEIVGNKYEKTSDRIAAIKLLGIDQNMFVQKQLVGHVNIEQALNELE